MSPQQGLLIRVWFETLFVIFHLSVLACVANQVVRRNSAFSTGFFKLYLAQSVVDVVAYYAVCTRDGILLSRADCQPDLIPPELIAEPISRLWTVST